MVLARDQSRWRRYCPHERRRHRGVDEPSASSFRRVCRFPCEVAPLSPPPPHLVTHYPRHPPLRPPPPSSPPCAGPPPFPPPPCRWGCPYCLPFPPTLTVAWCGSLPAGRSTTTLFDILNKFSRWPLTRLRQRCARAAPAVRNMWGWRGSDLGTATACRRCYPSSPPRRVRQLVPAGTAAGRGGPPLCATNSRQTHLTHQSRCLKGRPCYGHARPP